jgi:hypothetical protein
MVDQLELSLEARARLLTVDEIYSLADAAWLKILKEDRRVERKSSGIHARDLAQWFSMWANTAPHGGIVAIGVSDKGEIEGILSASVKHINEIERAGDNCCPDAKYEYKRKEVTNKDGQPDQILLIRVHYNGKKVVRTTDGSAFRIFGIDQFHLVRNAIGSPSSLCISDCVWLAVPQSTEWQRIGHQINAAMVFADGGIRKLGSLIPPALIPAKLKMKRCCRRTHALIVHFVTK